MTGQRLKPMGMGDIFDEGFDLYKKNLSFFLLVSALVVVPGFAIQQVIRSTLMHGSIPATAAPSDPMQMFDWFMTSMSSMSPVIVCSAVVNTLSVGALIAASSSKYINQPIATGGVFMLLLRRLVKLLTTVAAVQVVVMLCLCVCVLPGLFPLVYFLFAAHCVVIENPKLLSGISRSCSLNSGQAFRTLGFLIMLALLYLILEFAFVTVVTFVIAKILDTLPGARDLFAMTSVGEVNSQDQRIQSIGSSIANLCVTPFIISVLTVYYYDLRVRNEAYDVLALAQELNYRPLSELAPYLPSVMPPGAVIYSQAANAKPAKVKR